MNTRFPHKSFLVLTLTAGGTILIDRESVVASYDDTANAGSSIVEVINGSKFSVTQSLRQVTKAMQINVGD